MQRIGTSIGKQTGQLSGKNIPIQFCWKTIYSNIENFNILKYLFTRIISIENKPSDTKPCDPLQIIKFLLMQIEQLIHQVRTMIEACCHVKDFNQLYQESNQTSQDSIQLSQSISLCLYGTHSYTLWAKSIEDIPLDYR